MKRFEIKYLLEAITFLESIEAKAAVKIVFNVSKAQNLNDPQLFKKLKNRNIWEFRAEYNSVQYRLFAFWDKKQNAYVICTHGISKKTQKTPQKEIDKAEKIRIKYLGL